MNGKAWAARLIGVVLAAPAAWAAWQIIDAAGGVR